MPIKRGGLSMNRILYSNTRMVMEGFPKSNPQRFNLSFKYRKFEGGKAISTKCKSKGYLPTLHQHHNAWL